MSDHQPSPGAVSSVSGRTLKDYLRHDDGCDKGLCVDCRYTERGGHHSDCPDNCWAKHQFVARECSCGLDALLSVRAERASGQDEQTEDSTRRASYLKHLRESTTALKERLDHMPPVDRTMQVGSLGAPDSSSRGQPSGSVGSHDDPRTWAKGANPVENDLCGEFDAAKWAREFMRVNARHRIADDESTMLGWFANAIMSGYDHAKRELAAQDADPHAEIERKEP